VGGGGGVVAGQWCWTEGLQLLVGDLSPASSTFSKLSPGRSAAALWVVTAEEDDGKLRPWHCV